MHGLKSGKLLKEFKGHRSYINGVTYLPDANQIASCSSDATVVVWEYKTGEDKDTYPKRASSFTLLIAKNLVCLPDLSLSLLMSRLTTIISPQPRPQTLMPSLPTSIPRPYIQNGTQSVMSMPTQHDTILVLQLGSANVTPFMMCIAMVLYVASKYAGVEAGNAMNSILQVLGYIKCCFPCFKFRSSSQEANTEQVPCRDDLESTSSTQDPQDNSHT